MTNSKPISELAVKGVSDEGRVFFHSCGMCAVEWYHRGHGIVCLIQTEFNKMEPGAMCDIKIFFKGKNVTSNYVDRIFVDPCKIRTTLANIAVIISLIDENVDAYEDQEGEVIDV